MNPHPIVKDFDVIEDFVLRFLSGGEAFVMHQLVLQDAKKLSLTALSQQLPLRLMLC